MTRSVFLCMFMYEFFFYVMYLDVLFKALFFFSGPMEGAL